MVLPTLLLLAMTSLPVAHADDAVETPTSELAGDNGITYTRKMPMELNLRARYVDVPDSVLDIWYLNENDPGANPLPRPKARGYAVGVEYVLKPHPSNWIFYGEYIGNAMKEGYFDDIEEPAQHDDGDWIQPNGFGMVVLGANYAHEIEATSWVSFLIGGGLGLGIVTGELTQWNGGDVNNIEPDCLPNSAAYERRYACQNDGPKRIPGVLLMVDISAGVRFNFGDSANLRIEGGLHDMLYVGTAFGVDF